MDEAAVHLLVKGEIEAIERAIGIAERSLVERGLDVSPGVLVILDGGKGLRAAVRKAFRNRALVHRCQWHKRENVVSYLAKREQALWRQRLQRAYNRPEYDEALTALETLHRELEDRNQSAAGSLAEGLDETLTLHRLGLYGVLGRSLKTTNCLESVNALVEERCAKVDHWQNSSQRHRWLATALLDIEPRLRKVMGYRHLPTLRAALQRELKIDTTSKRKAAYAIRSRGEFQLRMGLTLQRLEDVSQFLARREIKELPNILWDSEQIHDMVQGLYAWSLKNNARSMLNLAALCIA